MSRGILGVIADTHGVLRAWEQALLIWGEVDGVLHCGDVLAHGASPLAASMKNSPFPIVIARGNCDHEEEERLLGLPLLSPYAILWWEGKLLIMGHGDDFQYLRTIGLSWNAHVVLSGHTHVGSVVREGSTIFLNPGSAAHPKGRDPASAALLNREGIRIFSLDENRTLHWEPWD